MAIEDRVDRAWLGALRNRLEAEPTPEELAQRHAWVEAVKRARVKVGDFDVVAVIREMRDKSADLSEYVERN